jgi:hypothetical protein
MLAACGVVKIVLDVLPTVWLGALDLNSATCARM